MKIVLAGATGLVGRLLLERLALRDDVSRIDIVARRMPDALPAKAKALIGAIEDWPCLLADLEPDVAISALGTTMRKAGSEDAFAAVDHGAVVAFARSARAKGARQFMLVSSIGARQSSRTFYLATKGRAENDVCAAGFERVDIFRPGLLRGARGADRRIGERIAIALSPITDMITPRGLDHYRSIAAADVAAAMAAFAGRTEPGQFIHDNRAMRDAIR